MPFTADQFFDVFRRYNEAVWPSQLGLTVAALVAVIVVIRPGRFTSQIATGVLAVLWLWTGAVYHLGFFRAVNPAAIGFGALCIAQSGLIAWLGGVRGRMAFHVGLDSRGIVGAGMVLYALMIYPVFGYIVGHRYPATPTFGLPCPTTIFTFGLFLWARTLPRWLLVVPVIWAAIGTAAAIALEVPEDFGLLVSGAIATPLLLARARLAMGHRAREATA